MINITLIGIKCSNTMIMKYPIEEVQCTYLVYETWLDAQDS